jgi:AcrR family transcriptional regulator
MKADKEPKRRDAPKTKAKILAAAQKAFSELGYSRAGIRDIAAIADVSSTLLLRYYGSKAALFEAALIDAMPVESMFDVGKAGFGERLAALFLDPRLEIVPPSIVSLSTGDAEAREITTRVMERYVVTPVAKWLGPPDARVRAAEITLLAMSFVLYTRQIPLLATPGGNRKLAQWFAESVQAIVDRS